MRKLITIVLTTALSLSFFLNFLTKISANTLTPAINETFLETNKRSYNKVTITNEQNKKISVTPKVYPYSAKDESLINGDQYIFVKTDLETFDIEPNSSLNINYEIIPPQNLVPGTYFNLIVFEEVDNNPILKQQNPINTSANLSQLIVLHITEAGNIKGITSDFANITFEITEKGLPFLKPTKIKYIFQNKTNYVLEPEGEIQIFNIQGKYQPQYIKINKDNSKLYPNDSFEEEIEINNWNIIDVISERKIIGRFYNGLDDNFVTKEVITENYILYLAGITFLIFLLSLFIKSLLDDNKKKN